MNLRSHATRLGVLDIGSNTVHMLIVDAAPGARPEPEASVKSTVRLMQYLKEDGTIRKAGVEAVLEAVQKAMKLAEEYEITQLLVLATSALREAPNCAASRRLSASRSPCCPELMRHGLPSLPLVAGMDGMPDACSFWTSVADRSKWPWVPMKTRPWH